MLTTLLRRGLPAVALVAGLALWAASPAAAQDTEPAPAAAQAAATTTVRGCLAKTDEGALHLTAESGLFVLTPASDEVDLAAHVGHQIEVVGTPGAMDPEAGEDAPKPLKVTAVKMLADSCSTR